MPASERDEARGRVVAGAAGVPMRELLAACAAAKVISTPPKDPAPEAPGTASATEEHRRAA
ncbi:MAG: hypothetical protein LBV60_07695 [Streptomyces sp.]|jgi:hypothetical protein|nr:hypothetical protein [Streptomyces sp.]